MEPGLLGDPPQRRDLYAPLRYGCLWLGVTYVAFLLVGQVAEVPDLFKLTAFVAATIVCFFVGYWLRAKRYRNATATATAPTITGQEIREARTIVTIGGLYFFAYGVSMLIEYGAEGLGGLVTALTNPGSAYSSKFDVYAEQLATGRTNSVVQVLTLLAALSTPLIPFLLLYRKHLTIGNWFIAGIGLSAYVVYFLYIGTLKGLGDLVMFTLTALLVLSKAGWAPRTELASRPKKIVFPALVMLSLFVGYMAFAQASRITEFGLETRSAPNPIVSAVVGEDLARGVNAVSFYPTHGYLGLAQNLDTPFEWTKGLGASRALDSYWDQYVGDTDAGLMTYPARTESRTGWPAGLLWATIYPWLASDLTWAGAAAFMGVVGWWLARFWYEAAFCRSRLAMLLLCQLALLIAYVPANNQIGIGRPSLIAFTSLAVLYWLNRVMSRVPRLDPARPSAPAGRQQRHARVR